jgi:hypothetical protein
VSTHILSHLSEVRESFGDPLSSCSIRGVSELPLDPRFQRPQIAWMPGPQRNPVRLPFPFGVRRVHSTSLTLHIRETRILPALLAVATNP